MHRFWEKVDKTPGHGPQGTCWIWKGSRGRRDYGRFRYPGGRKTSAHRLSYEMKNGPIPNGMLACHSCDNPPCVNPDHIFLGTHAENTADCIAKGRFIFLPNKDCGND